MLGLLVWDFASAILESGEPHLQCSSARFSVGNEVEELGDVALCTALSLYNMRDCCVTQRVLELCALHKSTSKSRSLERLAELNGTVRVEQSTKGRCVVAAECMARGDVIV